MAVQPQTISPSRDSPNIGTLRNTAHTRYVATRHMCAFSRVPARRADLSLSDGQQINVTDPTSPRTFQIEIKYKGDE